jgi:large subunit ribosomal protein L18
MSLIGSTRVVSFCLSYFMAIKSISRNELRKVRHRRVRGKVKGSAQKPRLNVFRSLRSLYAQVVNDEENRVIVGVDSRQLSKKGAVAEELGKIIAEKCAEKGIKEVVFDRGGNKYHGQVKMLADSARAAGLKF